VPSCTSVNKYLKINRQVSVTSTQFDDTNGNYVELNRTTLCGCEVM